MRKLLSVCRKYKSLIIAAGYLLPVLYAVISLLLKFWQADKGLVMSDEAWYLLLLKDRPENMGTCFYMYFHNVFKGSIYVVRITSVFLYLLGSSIYSLGLYLFFKDRLRLSLKNFYLIWAFASIALFSGVFLLWLCYFSLNQIALFLSTGLVLTGTQSKIRWISDICFFLSGLFLGTLFFIMITNILIILFVVLLVYLIAGSKWRNILFIMTGIISSLVVYFLCCDDFFRYFDELNSGISSTITSTEKHGLTGLLKWSKDTFIYLVVDVFTGAILLYCLVSFLINKDSRFSSSKIKIVLFLVVVFLIKLKSILSHDPFGFPSVTPFLVIYICLILFRILEIRPFQYKDIFLFIYIFFIPLFLSFGTDTQFELRSIMYIPFLLPVIYLLILYQRRYFCLFYFAFLMLVSVYFIHHMRSYSRNNYFNIIYTEQTNPLQRIGINQKICMDQKKFEILRQARNEINPGDYMVISKITMWGYVYLLDAKPVSYYFWIDENQSLEQLRKKQITPTSLKCFTSVRQDFSEEFLTNVRAEIQADTIIRKEFESMILYSFE